MSRIRPFLLNPFDGVGAGQKAWVKLSNGPTYQEIVIETNIPPAEIEKVTVDIGGVHSLGEIIEIEGAELVTFEKYKGVTVGTGPVYYYVIPFGSREAKTDTGELLTGLVTLPNDVVMLNVYQKGTLTPAAPYIKGHATASASRTERRIIPYIKPQTIVVTATGQIDYMSLPHDAGMEYRRLWMKGDINKAELWKDGVMEFESMQDVNEFLQDRRDRVPQSGWFVMDFISSGYVMADTFRPQHRNELKLRLDMAAAANVRCQVEGFKVLSEDRAQR